MRRTVLPSSWSNEGRWLPTISSLIAAAAVAISADDRQSRSRRGHLAEDIGRIDGEDCPVEGLRITRHNNHRARRNLVAAAKVPPAVALGPGRSIRQNHEHQAVI